MDDIDDLLDEVETKYVHGKNNSTSSSSITTTKRDQNPSNTSSTKSSVDDLISDILDVDVTDSSQSKKASSNTSSASQVQSEGAIGKTERSQKCFPVFLGGSSGEPGRGTTVNVRTCDQLRCTSCDFRICQFNNQAWAKDTDYLFLRNNVPNADKLKSKLGRKKGCRAYCCQCSWQNVSELAELKDPCLKWVCGKHVS